MTMKAFHNLIETLHERAPVRRKDIRMDPNSPSEGPYVIILALYDEPLTKRNEDKVEIRKIARDKHRFDDFDKIEMVYKNRAQDPFDRAGRSLNGKTPMWRLPHDRLRYHITNERKVREAKEKGVEVVSLSPPLQVPRDE